MKRRKPNIVLIMTDQQRADVCAREGFPLDTTPYLDSLAKEGIWFNRAYTASPVCTPARISTMTGRFPSAHRVRENLGKAYVTYEKDLIDVLKEQGYSTAIVGKNHSHVTKERVDHLFELNHDSGYRTGEPRTAEETAFDEWIHELNHAVAEQPAPFPLECQSPYRAVSDAESWIRSLRGSKEEEDSPFFLWLSFPEPHNPYQVPEPYYSMFPVDQLPPVHADDTLLQDKGYKWRVTRQLGEHFYPDYADTIPRARASYFGMLRMIDDQVQRFVRFLESERLREDTWIVFVSDHGDFVGEYGLLRKGPDIPELLMRVPLLFVGPGIRAGSEPHEAHVSLVDIMPTFCEMIGAEIPRCVQGRSLWPLLSGDGFPAAEFSSIYAEQGFGGLHFVEQDGLDFEACKLPGTRPSFNELNAYSQSGTLRMVRKGDWKLAFDMQGDGQLYHLAEDPVELNNLYGRSDVSSIQSEMLAELLKWTLRMQDPLPYPVKYRIKIHPKKYWSDEDFALRDA